MPPKMKELVATLADEFAKGDKRDELLLAKTLGEMAEIAKADKGGYAETEALKAQIARIQKGLDDEITARKALERRGVVQQDHQVKLLGRSEILDLYKVRRIFQSNERAEQFGAMCLRKMFGGRHDYADIVHPRTRGMADELHKALDPGVATAGAELVAAMFMADLIAPLEAVGKVFTKCDRVPLQTTGQTTWPRLTGELTMTPVAVAAALAESAPTFDTASLTPIKWGAIVPVPNEFFRNPTLLAALGQLLAFLLVRAASSAMDNALVNGDGTGTYGGITGVLQSATLASATAAAHQTLATYDGTDVSAVIAALAVDYVTDPYWLMSLSAERTLRALKATTGVPLYQLGSNGEPNTIDGYPYDTSNKFPAVAACTAAVTWGVFGDLMLSHLFGMLGGITIDSSEHVRFESDVTVLRGTIMVDADEKDPNALVQAITHA